MQLQLHYDINEDRLRLVIAEQEDARAWWITRRAAMILAEAMVARLSESVAPGMVGAAREWALSLRRLEAVQNNPITDTALLPVEHSHLLNSIRHGRSQDDQHVLVFVALDNHEQGFTFDDDSLFSIMELFRQQLARTGWGLELNWPKDDAGLGETGAGVQ